MCQTSFLIPRVKRTKYNNREEEGRMRRANIVKLSLILPNSPLPLGSHFMLSTGYHAFRIRDLGN